MKLARIFRSLFGLQTIALSADGQANIRVADNLIKTAAGLPECILHNESVFDADNQLCGHRFSATPVAGQTDIAVAQAGFLVAFGIAEFAKQRLAFIPVSAAEVSQGVHTRLATPNTVFVLDLRDAGFQAFAGHNVIQAIRDTGSRIAVSGISAIERIHPQLASADMALLHFAPAPELELQVRPLRMRYPNLMFAVDGVNTWIERRQCSVLNIEYCLGLFLTAPDELAVQERIQQNQVVLVQLINSLNNNAELTELSTIARQDPSLALHLIRLANAPSFGLTTPVASLEQAILFMGRSQLHRLLTMTMFHAGKAQLKNAALLELALNRAYFMEHIAASSLSRQSRDELFMLGLLSFFDTLLGIPTTAVLERMPLPKRMSEALLTGKGPYGRHLSLAVALHGLDVSLAVALADEIRIPYASVNANSHAALIWANGVLCESKSVA